MDPLRDILGGPVRELRELFEKALSRQLLGKMGIDATTGDRRPLSALHLDPAQEASRARIIEVLDHHEACGLAPKEAVARFLREAAFTHLNRLVALRMLEDPSRGVVTACVQGGREAAAFRVFRRVAQELGEDESFSVLLELMFDELAVEVGELFDTSDPRASLELPGDALGEAIAVLNRPELERAFAEDETVGWMYQLFTTVEERQASRKKFKGGPPSAEHLAFRNQFYTPRWVVEFLAENTLGRLLVSRRPDAGLAEKMKLLLPYEGPTPARPRSRPLEELKVLDPACGSGHFLIYCFDLLALAYEAEGVERSRIPSLIVGKNIHGIEIDRRAAQLASLALYLRAKRYERKAPVPPANIVVAQPMAADDALFAELSERLSDPRGVQVVKGIREAFSNADQIGCLYPMRRVLEPMLGGGTGAKKRGKQQAVQQALPIVDFSHWERRLREAIEALSVTAAASPARRLFLAEQRHDLSLVQALLTPFDVVLMNPPFGAPVPKSKQQLKTWYPRAGDKTNLYAACVEQGLNLLRPGGLLGAITDRSGFFITTFQEFREQVVLGMSEVVAFADLGFGILGGADDPAKVEAAAYVLRRNEVPV